MALVKSVAGLEACVGFILATFGNCLGTAVEADARAFLPNIGVDGVNANVRFMDDNNGVPPMSDDDDPIAVFCSRPFRKGVSATDKVDVVRTAILRMLRRAWEHGLGNEANVPDIAPMVRVVVLLEVVQPPEVEYDRCLPCSRRLGRLDKQLGVRCWCCCWC